MQHLLEGLGSAERSRIECDLARVREFLESIAAEECTGNKTAHDTFRAVQHEGHGRGTTLARLLDNRNSRLAQGIMRDVLSADVINTMHNEHDSSKPQPSLPQSPPRSPRGHVHFGGVWDAYQVDCASGLASEATDIEKVTLASLMSDCARVIRDYQAEDAQSRLRTEAEESMQTDVLQSSKGAMQQTGGGGSISTVLTRANQGVAQANGHADQLQDQPGRTALTESRESIMDALRQAAEKESRIRAEYLEARNAETRMLSDYEKVYGELFRLNSDQRLLALGDGRNLQELTGRSDSSTGLNLPATFALDDSDDEPHVDHCGTMGFSSMEDTSAHVGRDLERYNARLNELPEGNERAELQSLVTQCEVRLARATELERVRDRQRELDTQLSELGRQESQPTGEVRDPALEASTAREEVLRSEFGAAELQAQIDREGA